jgi:hypothetical protein
MSKITTKSTTFLFILLVIIIISGFYFSDFKETFTSSSDKNRGQGIGDTYAAPLDLPLNTDNTRFFGLSQIPTNM